MNSYGEVENALEDIYEQGGYVNIDSNTIINGDLQVTGNFSSGSGGAGTSTKIENGTGKVEVVSANEIKTTANNNELSHQYYQANMTDQIVAETHNFHQGYTLDRLDIGDICYFPFRARFSTSSLTTLNTHFSYLGQPTIRVSITSDNVDTIIYTTITKTLFNHTQTSYSNIQFQFAANTTALTEGTVYYIKIEKTVGTSELRLVGSLHSQIDLTIYRNGQVSEQLMDYSLKGNGTHTGLLHNQFYGELSINDMNVEQAIVQLQSNHHGSHYKLQSHSDDTTLHGKSLELGGVQTIYSVDFTNPPNINSVNNCLLIGYLAGYNISQQEIVCLGTQAGMGSGYASISLGYQSCMNNTGSYNIAIGKRALIGVSGSSTGLANVAIGTLTLQSLTTGTRNVCIGSEASKSLTTGSDNVVIGGYTTISNTLTTENGNTLIGAYTGIVSSGINYSIALGYLAKAVNSQQMVIGSTTSTKTINEVVPGIDANTSLGSNTKKFKNGYFSGDVSCANLTVSGELKVVNTSVVEISDNAIKLASGNIGDTLDSGVYSQYNDGATKYTGLVRDSTDGKYHLFDNLSTEPTTTINFANTTPAALSTGHLTATNATIDNRTPHGALSHHITQKSAAVGEDALTNSSGENNACFGYRAGSELTGNSAWRNTIIGSRNDTVHSTEAFPTSNGNLTMLGYHVSVDSAQNAISPIEYSIGLGSRCIIRESQSCTIGGWYGSFQILRVVPGTSHTTDLGSSTYRFKNLNISGQINSLLSVDYINGRAAPDADGTRDLGAGSLRWNDIYSVNSPIHSSDRNLKTDIVSTPLGLNFINKLNPVQYRFKEGKRPHQGLIAQEVRDTINDMKTDFAGYITGYQRTKVDVLDENTKQKIGEKEEVSETPYYALRYSEFIGPLIKAVQELSATVNTLKKEIEILKAK